MSRYIDADALIKWINGTGCFMDVFKRVAADIINKQPTVDAVQVVHGEWIEKWRFKTDGTPFHKIGDMECSVCHGDMLGRYYSKYCPHCGALLRGEHDERTNKA